MSQTRPNKVVTITNDETYDLAAHMARMADSANVVIPVSSSGERDALPKVLGTAVTRLDLNGLIEVYDGGTQNNGWSRDGGSTTPVATVTGAAGWTLTGSLVRQRATSGTLVTAGFMCSYGPSAGAFTLSTTFIKALTLNNPGFIPTADVFGYVLVLSSGNVVRADGAFNINPTGEIYIRMFSGTYSLQPTDKFYISANWNA